MGNTSIMHERCEKLYKILVRKPKAKGQHGRTRYRWEDNTKMNLREIV